ncbi:uncharacterized protein LOC122529153 [Frieseomelitta varia]|uniref:uncharacterized protein LOC122529153 n=1 Tax=Frieseomelitta varia TaxID=561572 RepID=UPI001CB6A655|nr:uncharacterized protein LOC122529153 [Frieseomelitta varia]
MHHQPRQATSPLHASPAASTAANHFDTSAKICMRCLDTLVRSEVADSNSDKFDFDICNNCSNAFLSSSNNGRELRRGSAPRLLLSSSSSDFKQEVAASRAECPMPSIDLQTLMLLTSLITYFAAFQFLGSKSAENVISVLSAECVQFAK